MDRYPTPYVYLYAAPLPPPPMPAYSTGVDLTLSGRLMPYGIIGGSALGFTIAKLAHVSQPWLFWGLGSLVGIVLSQLAGLLAPTPKWVTDPRHYRLLPNGETVSIR